MDSVAVGFIDCVVNAVIGVVIDFVTGRRRGRKGWRNGGWHKPGWRAERLAGKGDGAYFDEVPDWICEIHSPSTKHIDIGAKRRIYATYEVPYLWYIDPVAQTLEVFKLQENDWLLTHTFVGGQLVTAPPFDAITFDLKLLWPFDKPFETDGF